MDVDVVAAMLATCRLEPPHAVTRTLTQSSAIGHTASRLAERTRGGRERHARRVPCRIPLRGLGERVDARGYFLSARHQERAVGGAAEEGEAEPVVVLELCAGGGENPGGLAMAAGGLRHRGSGLKKIGVVGATVDSERVAQIGRSHEQAIDTVGRRDRIGVGQRVASFDLDAARHLRVGVVKRSASHAPPPGAVVACDAATAGVATGGHHFSRVLRRADLRHDDAISAGIERVGDSG